MELPSFPKKLPFFLLAAALSFLVFNQAHALRIVSLKPNITLTLAALEASGNIVGTTKFCVKPNATAEIVADYVSINAEKIIRLKPDLVLSSRENSQNRQYEILSNAGIRVEVLDFQNLNELYGSIEKLGVLLQREEMATQTVAKMRSALAELKVRLKGHNGKSFAVIVQRQPLMTASGNTFISTLLTSVGLKNIFEKNRIAYATLTPETLLQKKPDLIFDMDMTPGLPRGENFYGQPVIPLAIEDFLAAPQSVRNLKKILGYLKPSSSEEKSERPKS